MTREQMIEEMVKLTRTEGLTDSHKAFESFRFDFGVQWSKTKPKVTAETPTTPETEAAE